MLAMYQRSVEKHGLRYNPYIGDGDSSSYSRVSKASPYGVLRPIGKSECYVHVTKRMGTGLRKLIKEYKGIVFHFVLFDSFCLVRISYKKLEFKHSFILANLNTFDVCLKIFPFELCPFGSKHLKFCRRL